MDSNRLGSRTMATRTVLHVKHVLPQPSDIIIVFLVHGQARNVVAAQLELCERLPLVRLSSAPGPATTGPVVVSGFCDLLDDFRETQPLLNVCV